MNKLLLRCLYSFYEAREKNIVIFSNLNNKYKFDHHKKLSYNFDSFQDSTVEPELNCDFRVFKNIYEINQTLRLWENEKTLVLIINSNRTFKNVSVDFSNFHEFLNLLLRDQQGEDFYKKYIFEIRNIIIVDTNSVSHLRSGYQKLKQKNIIVLDKNIFYYLSIIRGISVIKNFLFNLPEIIKGFYWSYFYGYIKPKDFFKFSIFRIFNISFFENYKSYKALITTSNSLFVEYLRFYFLEDAECNKIVEVMHGVPDIHFERYFESINECFPKHTFIPLFKFNSSMLKSSMYEECSINIYINKYLSNEYLFSLDGFNIETLKIYYPSLIFNNNKKFLVQFIGGNCHEVDFFKSHIFDLEISIIKKLISEFKKYNIDPLFLYCPHPARSHLNFEAFFKINNFNIIISKETIITLFLSDIAVSILSTSLFEAKYFDINVLTPISSTDLIFSNENLLYLMPEEVILTENLDKKISKFILDSSIEITPNLVERANKRLIKYMFK